MNWSVRMVFIELPNEFDKIVQNPQVSDVVQEYRHAGLGLIGGCPLRQGERHPLCEFLSSFSSFVDHHALT